MDANHSCRSAPCCKEKQDSIHNSFVHGSVARGLELVVGTLAGGLELALTTKGAFLADEDRDTADCTGRPSSCRPERRAWAAMDHSMPLLVWYLLFGRRGAQKKSARRIM